MQTIFSEVHLDLPGLKESRVLHADDGKITQIFINVVEHRLFFIYYNTKFLYTPQPVPLNGGFSLCSSFLDWMGWQEVVL